MPRRAHILAALTLALALAVGVASGSESMGSAADHALRGLVGALTVALSAGGVGAALLRRTDALKAVALGLGVLGTTLLPISLLDQPLVLIGVGCAGALGWLARPDLRRAETPAHVWALLLPAAILGGLVALAPPVDTDEVYQHLALPRQILAWGVDPGPLQPNAGRPHPLHMVYAVALGLGGTAGPKLLHLGLSLALLHRVEAIARRHAGVSGGLVALLSLLGSYTLLRELGLAYNNLPAALFGLLAVEAALDDKKWQLAAFAGLALATKYTAAPVVLGAYLLYWRPRPRALGELALLTGAALLWLLPWWANNLFHGQHPLFPYAGWEAAGRFEFVYTERYGMGRGPLDLLLLPWNATVHAETTNYTFLGRISPLLLLSVPAAIYAAVTRRPMARAFLALSLLGGLGWAVGPHWLRYLLPCLPLLAVTAGLGAACLPRWGVGVMVLAWLAGLPSNLGPHLATVSQAAPVAMGTEDPEAFRSRALPGYDAAVFVNEHLPQDAVVAVLNAWPLEPLERRFLLGSVEDHVPTRHLLYVDGEESLDRLREAGATHVLAGRVNFIHKSYPFLDAATFREQFEEPEGQLEELLLAEGVVLFESGRYSVWRLR